MGHFAFITISGFDIESTKNYFQEWFFKKGDRKLITRKRSERWDLDEGEEDADERCYVYEISAKRLKRRLELAGFSLKRAEQEFYDCIRHRLSAVQEFEHTENLDYRKHVSVFSSASFDEWLSRLKTIVSQRLRCSFDFRDYKPRTDPILDILLNIPFYQEYADEWELRRFDSINWPAKNVECLARCVLEVVPKDASCQLDLTDLIHSGYTDSFDDLIEFESSSTRSLQVFDTAIGDIRQLMCLDSDNEVLARLLFANTITAMETYFGDTLRKEISRRESLLRRFVETSPELKEKKFPLSRVFEQRESILGQVMEIFDKTSFHNIELVKNIYCSVFSVQLDGLPFDEVEAAVEKRHDMVHRNGFDKEGKRNLVTIAHVEALIDSISAVLRGIDAQIKDGLLDEIERDDDEDVEDTEVAITVGAS